MKMLGYGLTAFAVASVPTAASAADLYDYPPPRAVYIAPPTCLARISQAS
jgi:hypothetical protein